MIIERIVSEYTIPVDESMSTAFKKIEAHREGALFAIDTSGAVEGVITIGDLIRWLSGQTVADLSVPLHHAMNRNFKSVAEGEQREKIDRILAEVNYIPILDGFNRLTGLFVVDDRRRPFASVILFWMIRRRHLSLRRSESTITVACRWPVIL